MRIEIRVFDDNEKEITSKKIVVNNKKVEEGLSSKTVDIAGIYYSTYDYTFFNHMIANALIDDNDVKKVAKGYKDYGYMTNPIAITAKGYVFDGEKRLQVHQNEGWPIEFTVIDENFGEEDTLNSHGINNARKGKDIHDYIHYWAAKGNENYIRLEELDKKYQLSVSIIYSVLKNVIYSGSMKSYTNIKSGNAIVTEEEVVAAIPYLDFLMNQKKYFSLLRKQGTNPTKFTLLAWCYRCPGVDKERFMDILVEADKLNKLSPISTIDKSLEELTKLYNYKKKTCKVDFRKLYAEMSKDGLWNTKF